MTDDTSYYTLVRHPAARDKAGFAREVQLRHVDNARDMDRVRRAGGLFFPSYEKAYSAEKMINIVGARGTFSTATLGKQAIYVPARNDPARLQAVDA